MCELNNIFELLEKKRQLIIKYEEDFNNLEKQKNLISKKEYNKQYKLLYKTFEEQMKLIEQSY